MNSRPAQRVKPLEPLRENGVGPFLLMVYVTGLIVMQSLLISLGQKSVLSC
jgi:hypothetical protein